MKILLLADPSNPHTIKWVNSLSEKEVDIFLFGLSKYDDSLYPDSIKIESFRTPSIIKSKLSGNVFKIIYISAFLKIKRIIDKFKPDIIHAHYAGSYGLLGALTKFHPYILSVWGVDINIYPKVSFIHNYLIKYSLNKADTLLATSKILKEETKKYTHKEIEITPFGIDLHLFKKINTRSIFSSEDIVIGTVKRLEEKYGIDDLIKAFGIVRDSHPNLSLKLLLVGDGSIREKLTNLVNQLDLDDVVTFAGEIPISKVVDYHNMMDIEVFLSKTESFGVSVLEASATETPVIVTNVGGLPEVVEDGVTGIVVPLGEIDKTVKAIDQLIFDYQLRIKMGKAGRTRVISLYSWEDNVQQMINIYERVIKNNAD